jgi:CRP/FNR family transcriptional regulator, cyclic AMP receptor protein
MASAHTITACALLKIERIEMLRVLRDEHAFADIFVAYLLERNVRVQEDLVDQLINSSEKRLARVLLLLAQVDIVYDRTIEVRPSLLSMVLHP